MSQPIISFVEQDSMRKIEQIDDLKEQIELCRKSKTPLSHLDLSAVELANLDMSGLEISDVIFNSYDVQDLAPKLIRNLSFQGAKLTRVSFAHCRLIRCNFDRQERTMREQIKHSSHGTTTDKVIVDTELSEVDFFMCQWQSCRLRKTIVTVADFRYSSFENCSMGGCRITLGDFYMTAFKGTTNFMESHFIHCSITNATFDHDCIRIKGIEGLAQESYEDYSSVIIGHKRWYKQNPCGNYSHQNEGEDKGDTMRSKSFTHHEASVVYAHLSGFYAGKGLFKDSNIAYERAKRNEAWASYYAIRWEWQRLIGKTPSADELRPRRTSSLQNIGKELLRLLNFGLCWTLGFGYKLSNVVICFIVLVVGFSVLFHWKSIDVFPWHTELAYSLNNSIGSFDLFINVLGAWISSMQTTIGILIVGFAGFVIANRIRNNY